MDLWIMCLNTDIFIWLFRCICDLPFLFPNCSHPQLYPLITHIQWTCKSYRFYILNILNLFSFHFYCQQSSHFVTVLPPVWGLDLPISLVVFGSLASQFFIGHGLNQQDRAFSKFAFREKKKLLWSECIICWNITLPVT